MTRHFNLPPGVTIRDISGIRSEDEDCEECEGTGLVDLSICCDASVGHYLNGRDIQLHLKDAPLICFRCRKEAERQKCLHCNGTGLEPNEVNS